MATVTDLESYQQFAQEQQAQNNEWSAQQAQKQMDFQKMMSDTAHQREVADLKAAGLNPVLAAGGQGASSAQGAAAEADTSAAGNVGAILQQVLQAQSAREVAGMYNAATIAAAQIAAGASMYGADMSYQNAEDHPKTFQEVLSRFAKSFADGVLGGTKNAWKALLPEKLSTSNTAQVVDRYLKQRGLITPRMQSYNSVYSTLNWRQKIAWNAYKLTHKIKNPTAAQLQSWLRARK